MAVNSDTSHPPLVLIVDDVATNRQILASALQTEYQIRTARDGAEALDLANTEPRPDLVLLDIMMPGIDGYEVCRRLKSCPTTSRIPVIFVTVRNSAEDEAAGLDLGAVDYIAKPFYLPIVRARVRTHIRLKRSTDLLERLAWLDGLTEIPNRRRFDQMLQHEWLRATRTGQPLAVAMIDVDFFKAFNDRYGHGAGDRCLREIAATLVRCLNRPGDLAARYGGEEFALLLPATDLAGALRIAECCCQAIRDLAIPHDRSPTLNRVSISIGLATDIPPRTDPDMLMRLADDALYRAKTQGRDQIRA